MIGTTKRTTTQRGYGWPHHVIRQRLEPIVAAGAVLCARCGKLILPGEPWHLGHDDYDRSRYTGPEHVSCNCATAGRQRPTSRRW